MQHRTIFQLKGKYGQIFVVEASKESAREESEELNRFLIEALFLRDKGDEEKDT